MMKKLALALVATFAMSHLALANSEETPAAAGTEPAAAEPAKADPVKEEKAATKAKRKKVTRDGTRDKKAAPAAPQE
jgi:hypothetical protein